MQAYQEMCVATGRMPKDQATVVLLPLAETTPVQTAPANRDLHPGYGSGCSLNLRHYE